MASYEQRSYAGAAADTTLAAPISAGVLAFTVATGTGSGYPDGSGGPFFVIIDYDNTSAEKIRVTSRTGDAFTVPVSDGRGNDGTAAVSHGVNAKVRHVITATDMQEANRAAVNTVGKVTTKGDVLAGTGSNTLARVPAGANNTVFVADSTQTAGVNYKTLAALLATLTSTKGDLLVFNGTTVTRLAAGADGTFLIADSTQAAGLRYTGTIAKTVRVPHTFAVSGTLAVASGATNYIPPFYVPVPSGQTAVVRAARASTRAGTVTVNCTRNGTSVTGLGAVGVTTTAGTTSATANNTCADGDAIGIVLSSPAAADGLTFTIYIDYGV